MNEQALDHLAGVDPVMAGLIEAHGPCPIRPKIRPPFEALVRAIAHQQLHGAAAETILKRFRALFETRGFPTPGQLDRIQDPALRTAGFSKAKVAAIRDLAAKTKAGIVPGRLSIRKLDDEEIVERLIAVRGVGRWTVEMLLIFTLGRQDVLPVDDFGVRNGFRIAYGKRTMPKPQQLLLFGERWRPHRTTASWYLWRAADMAKSKRPPK